MEEKSKPSPIRIRYYGLFRLSKRAYLTLQVPVLAICFCALLVVLVSPERFGINARGMHPVSIWVLDHLLWIVAAATVLEVLDTIFVLRRFAQHERQNSDMQQHASSG
jgi:hypothetical protein